MIIGGAGDPEVTNTPEQEEPQKPAKPWGSTHFQEADSEIERLDALYQDLTQKIKEREELLMTNPLGVRANIGAEILKLKEARRLVREKLKDQDDFLAMMARHNARLASIREECKQLSDMADAARRERRAAASERAALEGIYLRSVFAGVFAAIVFGVVIYISGVFR